ncbi:MAG: response regulator transcription factor [Ignavibacteriaceae bacterium]
MKKKKIIIADDHPIFRSGVRMELEKEGSLNIIGEAGDGNEALAMINKLNPDVAILDFQMPGLTGIEIAEKLSKSGSHTKIILLTMHNEKKIFLKALEVGIEGYVLKNDAVLDIVTAVNRVIDGNYFLSPKLTGLLMEKAKIPVADENLQLINRLTPTEKNIMQLISELNSNEEIAEKLFISKRTVENQKVLLSKKLNLEGAKGLLKFSVKYNEYLK